MFARLAFSLFAYVDRDDSRRGRGPFGGDVVLKEVL
jgi:hypothetical protein